MPSCDQQPARHLQDGRIHQQGHARWPAAHGQANCASREACVELQHRGMIPYQPRMASHGRYTIRGKLADGGMAEIFLAVQHGAEGFEKPVVLKRILTQYSADPQFRNMLLDEAHISMSLQHGNIVQVLDLGVASGRYFLALELVDGWDLEKILQRAHAAGLVWPSALALYVGAVVCRALAYAHGQTRDGKPLGIVHRDISPNNVLVSAEGEVKLADFGIAKAQRKREQTAAGVIKGKVAYMSPEQAQGGAVDRRSDIFSVGSMLYRMVTDHLPFEATNDLESLLRVQKADFPPPQKVKETVGDSVATIIQRAMRLSPADRYQTRHRHADRDRAGAAHRVPLGGPDRAEVVARAAGPARRRAVHRAAARRRGVWTRRRPTCRSGRRSSWSTSASPIRRSAQRSRSPAPERVRAADAPAGGGAQREHRRDRQAGPERRRAAQGRRLLVRRVLRCRGHGRHPLPAGVEREPGRAALAGAGRRRRRARRAARPAADHRARRRPARRPASSRRRAARPSRRRRRKRRPWWTPPRR